MLKEFEFNVSLYELMSVVSFGTRNVIFDRLRYLIDNAIVIHNDFLGIDYVLKEVIYTEPFFSDNIIINIEIEIVYIYDAEIVDGMELLRTTLEDHDLFLV